MRWNKRVILCFWAAAGILVILDFYVFTFSKVKHNSVVMGGVKGHMIIGTVTKQKEHDFDIEQPNTSNLTQRQNNSAHTTTHLAFMLQEQQVRMHRGDVISNYTIRKTREETEHEKIRMPGETNLTHNMKFSEMKSLVVTHSNKVKNEMAQIVSPDNHKIVIPKSRSKIKPRVVKSKTTPKPPYCNVTVHPSTYYRTQPHMVNQYKTRFLLQPNDTCANNTFLVIVVHSLHSNYAKRRAIRHTWGSVARGNQWPIGDAVLPNISLVFLFGVHEDAVHNERIRDESKEYGDVIQGDFVESYRNMTLKNIMGLKWITEYCTQAKYILKSDDDVFANIPAVIKLLKANHARRTFIGPRNPSSPVMRGAGQSKWSLTCDEFPFDKFPSYMSGSAYIMTSYIVNELFMTSQYVYPIFIDDVFVTGILAKILKINIQNMSGFVHAEKRAPKLSDYTSQRTKRYTDAIQDPNLAFKLWNDLQNLSKKQQNRKTKMI